MESAERGDINCSPPKADVCEFNPALIFTIGLIGVDGVINHLKLTQAYA